MPQLDKRIVLREIVILAFLTTLSCTAIAWGQPLPVDSQLRGGDWPAAIGLECWIWLQSAALAAAVVLLAACLQRLDLRLTRVLSTTSLLILPFVMVADAVMFRWTGERFLSTASWHILTEFPSRLAPYATSGMTLHAAWWLAATLGWLYFIRQFARWMTRRWPDPTTARKATIPLALVSLAVAAIGAAPLRQPDVTLQAMAADSTRHPFCVLRLIPFRGVSGPRLPPTPPMVRDVRRDSRNRRQLEQRLVSVDRSQVRGSHPDVLIVIVESFRRELVTPEIMPNLWSLAQDGLHCRNHFSGGNATNHGMFSLINGLEAIWYQQPVTYSPLLNRLYHAAGYEIGFFGGHDDSSKPRLAVLYLYATHAIYQSYSDDQIFQPAADDRLGYPYSPGMREQVWNRYKNSARTVDRFLGAVMRKDLVILVTGDHGESFLEDGTIGHGIRISEYQNMTPAVIYARDLAPRSLELPTSHVDLLPTLLDITGIPITTPGVFDGVSLRTVSESQLSSRVFATCNYLDDHVGLIGPWTSDPDAPFAYRVEVSLELPQFTALNAIERTGYDAPLHSADDSARAIARWLEDRFPALPR